MTLYSLASFQKGQRIQLHPATDQWMQGQRYAEVTKVGRKVITIPSRSFLLTAPGICPHPAWH